MKDLSNVLQEAARRKNSWSYLEALKAIMLLLRRLPRSWLDWGEESGEEWARIMFENDVSAFIRIKLPIIMMKNNTFPGPVMNTLKEKAVVIEFQHFEHCEFSIDMQTFEEVFEDCRWRKEAGDPACFSAHDLYWMTDT